MPEIDAAFKICVICGHVVGADQVVNALSRTADCCDNVITRLELCNIFSDCFHLSEALMAKHQEFVSRWRRTVFGSIDFLVGAIHADAQYLYQHTPPIGNFVQ